MRGNYNVQQALSLLLAGTGLEAILRPDGSYALRSLHALPVPNEESNPSELFFQPPNVMADCAVRETYLVSGAAIAEVSGGRVKTPETQIWISGVSN